VEIVADEIGPSLRWAQATVERTEREKSDVSRDAPPRQQQRQPDPLYGDEEPF
jgi:single-strand DNA-binding protein